MTFISDEFKLIFWRVHRQRRRLFNAQVTDTIHFRVHNALWLRIRWSFQRRFLDVINS